MSSDSSSDEEVVWSERKQIIDNNDDDLMSFLGSGSTASSKATPKGITAKLEAKKLKEKEDEKVKNSRELNPFVRHVGSHIRTVGTTKEQQDMDRPMTNKACDKQEQVVNTLSIAERNAIHAKIMKAEMLGNLDLVKKLRAQLESPQIADSKSEEQTKVKYFTVDNVVNEESMSVKEMYLKEKRSTRNEEVGLFVASCSKIARNPDDEYEDEEKRKKKKRSRHDEDAPRRRYIEDDNEQDCKQCMKNTPRHLVVTSGDNFFVSLPPYEPLTYGDCAIQSISHSNQCVVSLDEDCLQEVNERKHDICRTFDRKGLAVIFLETYFRRNKSNKHLKIDCYTIKKKYEGDAKMYFKKAIMECEEEWSMNKKLVDLNGKCVSRMVPKGLSYFCVSFGTQSVGYAHIIENEESFSPHFGIEILGGILDIDRFRWKRPKMQNYDDQYKRVAEIKSLWKM